MPGLNLQSALIWFSAPFLQLLCVYLLRRRKLLSEFPLATSYFLFLTLLNVVRFSVYREFGLGSWAYYSVYWVGTALANMVVIAVLYEIFCAAFKPFAGLQDLAKIVFKWAAGCLLCIGLLLFVSSSASVGGPPYWWLMQSVHNFERIVGVMEFALLVFLFVGSHHLGLAMRDRVFGFALGFGFSALSRLIIWIALISVAKSKIPFWSQLLQVSSYMALLIWVGYLLKPERAQEPIHIPVTSPLLRWNEVAQQLGHSGGKVALLNSEPFMPQVQRIVKAEREFVERRRAQYRTEMEPRIDLPS